MVNYAKTRESSKEVMDEEGHRINERIVDKFSVFS